MAGGQVRVDLDLRGLERLRTTIDAEADKVVRRHAAEVMRKAVRAVPVDTGALRNSIYMETSSTYGTSRVAALAKARRGSGRVAEVPAGYSFLRPGEAVVGTPLEYGIYIEMGTVRSAAQPYLLPALESQRNSFLSDLKAILDYWARSGGL